jgi:hypothetical protein
MQYDDSAGERISQAAQNPIAMVALQLLLSTCRLLLPAVGWVND